MQLVTVWVCLFMLLMMDVPVTSSLLQVPSPPAKSLSFLSKSLLEQFKRHFATVFAVVKLATMGLASHIHQSAVLPGMMLGFKHKQHSRSAPSFPGRHQSGPLVPSSYSCRYPHHLALPFICLEILLTCGQLHLVPVQFVRHGHYLSCKRLKQEPT